jgi:hypothetical protein
MEHFFHLIEFAVVQNLYPALDDLQVVGGCTFPSEGSGLYYPLRTESTRFA